jgi:hypothetical protein
VGPWSPAAPPERYKHNESPPVSLRLRLKCRDGFFARFDYVVDIVDAEAGRWIVIGVVSQVLQPHEGFGIPDDAFGKAFSGSPAVLTSRLGICVVD